MIKNSIYIVSGDISPYDIERLDFDGDQLVNQGVIGYSVTTWNPILLEVSDDFCV